MRAPDVVLVIVLSNVVSPAAAQEEHQGRLRPIAAPIRNAGVYHVASGTWTRSASLANVLGPDTIYDNTCAAVYYSPLASTESYQHRSRIPSTSGPTTPSAYFGFFRHDTAPGCRDSYTVNGFQVAYCSDATQPIAWSWDFASSYTQCHGADMVSQYNVTVTGLPGGNPGTGLQCWIVDVDLSGNSGGGIVLSADGDGTYAGPSTAEQFGFSLTHDQTIFTQTGPIVAGDFAFTGGPATGLLTPCTGTDGTIWDNPIDLGEPGTGMSSSDFFRVAATPGPVTWAAGPGCYGFGAPHADFWLKLYADPGCPAPSVFTEYCFPGEGGTRACTTCSPANPPSAHGRGCDNFGQHTGGAQLTAAGISRVSQDTIVFTSSFENDTAFTIVMQGTGTANAVFGAGVRCVAGDLRRIYTGSAGSAANGDPAGTIHRPGPSDPTSVHQASLNRGYDIAAHAPVGLAYLAYYRDPMASAYCGGATFNATESGYLTWLP
jgi:hypothetical protein